MINKEQIKNITGVVFFGALGSGLWSTLGEPTAGFVYEFFQMLGGAFAAVVGDFTNNGVGSGGWEDRGSTFFLVASIFALFMYIIKFALKVFSNQIIRFVLIGAGLVFVVSFTYKTMYAHKLSLYFDKNIEVLAPYMTNSEYLYSRSYYRLINDLESFNHAQDYLLDTSDKYGIDIQRFAL